MQKCIKFSTLHSSYVGRAQQNDPNNMKRAMQALEVILKVK